MLINLPLYRELRAANWNASLALKCSRSPEATHAIVPAPLPPVSERAARVRDEVSLFCGR